MFTISDSTKLVMGDLIFGLPYTGALSLSPSKFECFCWMGERELSTDSS
jgi:hypothetical protein